MLSYLNEKKRRTLTTLNPLIPGLSSSSMMNAQSCLGTCPLHDGVDRMRSRHNPWLPLGSLGAWKVATAEWNTSMEPLMRGILSTWVLSWSASKMRVRKCKLCSRMCWPRLSILQGYWQAALNEKAVVLHDHATYHVSKPRQHDPQQGPCLHHRSLLQWVLVDWELECVRVMYFVKGHAQLVAFCAQQNHCAWQQVLRNDVWMLTIRLWLTLVSSN